MKRHLQALRFALRHLGLFGWLGASLILGAVFYATITVPERNAELAVREAQIDRMQSERLALANGSGNGLPGKAKAVIDIPSVAIAPQVMLALEDTARKDGLDIKRSDYRYIDPASVSASTAKGKIAAGDRIVEVRITTPASGNYPNLRAFLAHALEKQPTLALDDLSIKRDSIANGNLQAQLRFTLFVRNEP